MAKGSKKFGGFYFDMSFKIKNPKGVAIGDHARAEVNFNTHPAIILGLIFAVAVLVIGLVVVTIFTYRQIPPEQPLALMPPSSPTGEIDVISPMTTLPTQTATVTATPGPSIKMLTPSPAVYIADWSGSTLYPGDKLILFASSCVDKDGYSTYSGTKPKYWIFYETWIGITFVNSSDTPNGIITIEPVYENDFDRTWKLNVWYITIYENNGSGKPISLPIELPPKTPRKWYFRAITVAEADPKHSSIPVIEYGDTLSPLILTFNIVNHEQVTHISDLYVSVGEAVDDGKLEFTKNCKEIIPEWPYVPLPGRQLPDSNR